MKRFIKRLSKKAGLPPGTLVHIGEKKVEKAKITIIDYEEAQFQKKLPDTVEECFPFKDKPNVTWINIDGIHEVEIVEKLGKCYGIHPLALEDIVNTEHRPKMEDFGEYVFVIVKMLYYDEKESEIKAEQVSFVLGSNFVISFQEMEGDVFNTIRKRIEDKNRRIRKWGADYLLYALLDVIVDNYFIILEKLGEQMECLEEELLTNPTNETLHVIHNLKREMAFLRKSVWPLREVISSLERSESSLIHKSTSLYLRDVYDHTIQVIDTIEAYKDILSGMLDIYLSSISNSMNAVMKVLTIIATIFIPLTFIAGIYGMNFKYMPELEWHWGYFTVWFIMVCIGALMIIYFKRRMWL